MESIKKWLSDPERSFSEGTMLFMKHGGQKRLAAQMMAKIDDPNDYLIQKLVYLMEKMAGTKAAKVAQNDIPVTKQQSGPTTPIIIQAISTRSIPEEAKAFHKEHGYVHEQMRSAKTDADRLTHAKNIMEVIIPSLDAIYQGKPLPKSTGTTASIPEELTELQISKKIDLLVSQISKCRAKIKNGATDQDEKLADLIIQKDALKKRLTDGK